MSAFIVDKATIDLLVGALPQHQAAALVAHARSTYTVTAADTATDRAVLGAILWEANLAAVAFRYDDDDLNTLPGPLELTFTNTPVFGLKGLAYTFDPTPATAAGVRHHSVPMPATWPVSTVAAVGQSAGCYEYQTSDKDIHPLVALILDTIRSTALAALPGVDDAPWGWTDADTAAAVAR